jgi:DNA-binding transcriptional ArsR family regulator
VLADDAVDRAVLLCLLRCAVAVAVQVVVDLLDALTGVVRVDLVDLAAQLERLSRVDQAIAKHLAALGDAGLIGRAPDGAGREVRYRLRPGALRPASAWLDETAAAWDERLVLLATSGFTLR